MIYVRNDDVLMGSSSWTRPFLRFKEIHEWICEVPEFVLHVPTILTTDIQEFPEAVEYIREETKQKRMSPQLHGVKHIDYGKLSYDEVVYDLETGKEWMQKSLGLTPTRWYTPWGAGEAQGQEYLRQAATAANMEMVTCANINKMVGRYGIVQQFRDGHEPRKFLEGKEIFMHWWERGERLYRILTAIKKGFWDE